MNETITSTPHNVGYAVVYSPMYQIRLYGLEKLHPFDIQKYEKIFAALTVDGFVGPEAVFAPSPLSDANILLVHSEQFLADLKNPYVVAGYLEAPSLAGFAADVFQEKVIDPFRYASGGTLLAAEKALERGVGINIGGGYHHAKPDYGEGFCIFADIPIAIRKLQKDRRIEKALVVDTDVHQGNGTVVCLKDDASTFTFSMHQRDIYPIPKEWSDLDIELSAGQQDSTIIAILEKSLPGVFERARPDIVFYIGGCDTLSRDPLASLNMTPEGIVERDAVLVRECQARKIPLVMTLAGGYSVNAWEAQYKSVYNIIDVVKQNKER